MADADETPTRRPITSGRVTPKGGVRKTRRSADSDGPAATSSRYTPPTPGGGHLPSPTWVPVLMFVLFGLGMLTLILNYLSLLPGAVSNWYLLAGLGFILGGIITATQYR